MNTADSTPTMNPLHTNDPVALRYLMSETIFDIEEGEESAVAFEATESAAEIDLNLTYLGKNQSGFLFVFQDLTRPDQHSLVEQEMEAFEKTLGAMQLSLDHIALFNLASIASRQTSFADVLTFFDARKVILLGTQLSIAEQGSLLPALNLHEVAQQGTVEYLHTFSFAEMMNDTDKKRLFWTSLKAMLTAV